MESELSNVLLSMNMFISVLFCDHYRKYEEIYPPEVGEFVYITDDTYTKQQVLLSFFLAIFFQ